MDRPLSPSFRVGSVLFAACFSLFTGFPTAGQDKAPGKQSRSTVAMCQADQMSFGTDDEGGNFNGMSHSGTLLVLRNLGSKACEMPAIPELSFFDEKGRLHAKRESSLPKFIHPGPVAPPAIAAPGAELTATMRWVAGKVYEHSVCIEPTRLAIAINGKPIQTAFQGRLCGDHAKGISYQTGRLAADPTVER